MLIQTSPSQRPEKWRGVGKAVVTAGGRKRPRLRRHWQRELSVEELSDATVFHSCGAVSFQSQCSPSGLPNAFAILCKKTPVSGAGLAEALGCKWRNSKSAVGVVWQALGLELE